MMQEVTGGWRNLCDWRFTICTSYQILGR